jgi:hypothetical protein
LAGGLAVCVGRMECAHVIWTGAGVYDLMYSIARRCQGGESLSRKRLAVGSLLMAGVAGKVVVNGRVVDWQTLVLCHSLIVG